MGNGIVDILDKAIAEICDKYCEYPEQWDPEEHDGMELCESEICENCPLTKLYGGR